MVFNKEKFEECYKLLETHCDKNKIPFKTSELCKLINDVKKASETFSKFVNRKEGYVYLIPMNEQRSIVENNLKKIKELSGYSFKLRDFIVEEKNEQKTS